MQPNLPYLPWRAIAGTEFVLARKPELSYRGKLIGIVLSEYWRDTRPRVVVSQKELAAKTGFSLETVRKGLLELKRAKLLRWKGHLGMRCAYELRWLNAEGKVSPFAEAEEKAGLESAA